MTTLEQAIEQATEKSLNNGLKFATIWKTGKSFGFNWDVKQLGYKVKEYGVKREVVKVLEF